MKQNSIKPGQIWLDTNGKPIQAHGGSGSMAAASV